MKSEKFNLCGGARPKSALSAGSTPSKALQEADCNSKFRLFGQAGGGRIIALRHLLWSTYLQNQDLQHRTAVMIGLTEPKSSIQTRIMNYS